MGLRNSIKSWWNNLVSEFITNKDTEKGILDYDRYQEYEKLSEGASDTQQQQLSTQMTDKWIIDPTIYRWYKAKQVAKLQDPNSDEAKSVRDQSWMDNFTKEIQATVAPQFSTWDRRQKDVLSKATEEMTKDYADLYDAYSKTYDEYKDPALKSTWESTEPKIRELIKNSTTNFSKYIAEGMSYQDAYKKLIDTNKEAANELVTLQSKIRNQAYLTGIKGAYKSAWDASNPLEAAWSVFKTAMNTVTGLTALVGQWVEEWKQALGYYDTLEELSNLWVYKDNEKMQWLKKVGNWAFEVFDGAPNWLPELWAMLAGNAWSTALKLPEMITAWLRWIWLADKAAKATRTGKFLANSLEDLFLYDSLAQASMGRPMTDQDFTENWMYNLPLNGILWVFSKTDWLKELLPIETIDRNNVSLGLRNWMVANPEATEQQVAKAIYLDHAYKMWTNEEATSLITAASDDITKQLQSTENLPHLDNELQTRYNQWFDTLATMTWDIQKGKVSFDDMSFLNVGSRIKKTWGKAFGIESAEDAINKGTAQYDYLKEWFDRQGSQAMHTKTVQLTVGNLVNQGKINTDNVDNLLVKLPEDSVSRLAIESMFPEKFPEAKAKFQEVAYGGKANYSDLNAWYEVIQTEILRNMDGYNITPWTNIGWYRYLGKDVNGEDKFFNIFSPRTLSKEEVYSSMWKFDKNISAKAESLSKYIKDYKSGTPAIEVVSENWAIHKGIDISPMFTHSSMTETVLKSGETTNALSNFWIKKIKTTSWYVFIWSEKWIQRLNDAVNKFDKEGRSITNITEDQLNAYKVIFLWPYIKAFEWYKKFWVDFKTYFEKLFIKSWDEYQLNLKHIWEYNASKDMQIAMQWGEGFFKAEAIAAEYQSEDWFKSFVEWTNTPAQIKNLTMENETVEQKLLSIATLIKGSDKQAELLAWLKWIVWDILADHDTHLFIKSNFNWIDNRAVYRNILSSMVAKDATTASNYLESVVSFFKTKWIAIEETAFYARIQKARELLATSKDEQIINNVRNLLDEQQKMFEDKLIDLPKDFYNKYDELKNTIELKELWELTDWDIDKVSEYFSYAAMDRYWVMTEWIKSKLRNSIRNMIYSLQKTDKNISLLTWSKWFAADVDSFWININDAIGFNVFKLLSIDENYYKYVAAHEYGHLLTHKEIAGNLSLLGRKLQEWIESISKYDAKLNLNDKIFYSKDSINEAMQFLDIFTSDKNELVDRLITLKLSQQDIPSLYKLLDQVEEVVMEQQWLAQVYWFVSNKELVAKIKDSLPKINEALSNNEIVSLWESFMPGKTNEQLEVILSQNRVWLPELAPQQFSVKEIKWVKDEYSYTDLLKKETGKYSRDKTFNETNKALIGNEAIWVNDFLDMASWNLSYMIDWYGDVLKKMFPDMGKISIDKLYVWKESLDWFKKSFYNTPLTSEQKYILANMWWVWAVTKQISVSNINEKLLSFDKDTARYIYGRLDSNLMDSVNDTTRLYLQAFPEIYIGNKVINNILANKVNYNSRVINNINKAIALPLINSAVRIMNKQKESLSILLLKELESDWYIANWLESFASLSKWKRTLLWTMMINYYNNWTTANADAIMMEIKDVLWDRLMPKIEWLSKEEKDTFIDFLKKWEEWWFFWMADDLDWVTITNTLDNIMNSFIDNIKLKKDINMLYTDIPDKELKYNSYINAIALKDSGKQFTIDHIYNNWAAIREVANWRYLASIEKTVSKMWVLEAFRKGKVTSIVYDIGNKQIVFDKKTIETVNPYKLLNQFMWLFDESWSKYYSVKINGKGQWIKWVDDFFSSTPWIIIRERLKWFDNISHAFNKYTDEAIAINDKDMLLSIYDSLAYKTDMFNSKANKLAQELYDKIKWLDIDTQKKYVDLFQKGIDKIRLGKDIDDVTQSAYVKSVLDKLNDWRKFTKDEWELYARLKKYLYPKVKWGDKLFTAKRLEDLSKAWDYAIIKVRPEINSVVSEIYTMWDGRIKNIDSIEASEYSNDWVHVSSPSDLDNMYHQDRDNPQVNFTTEAMPAMAVNKNGDVINGILIAPGKWQPNQFIPHEWVEDIPIQKIKEIAEENTLPKYIEKMDTHMQKHLTCKI